jgi:hypothetical protein
VARKKRRSITWQQALLLLVVGVVIEYPSFEHLNIWGGRPPDRFDGWDVLGVFVGVGAFIAGCLGFLWITVGAVTSSTGSEHVLTGQTRSATGAIPRGSPSQSLPEAGTKRRATAPGSAAPLGLRTTLAAAIAFFTLELLHPENRPHASMFGPYYLFHFGLSFALSQIPYAVALIRVWKMHDRAGIALSIPVGVTQVLATLPLFAALRYPFAPYDLWPWLNASLGLAVVVFAILASRAVPSREGDVGLLISMFFGVLIYTAIAQITLEIISNRVRV